MATGVVKLRTKHRAARFKVSLKRTNSNTGYLSSLPYEWSLFRNISLTVFIAAKIVVQHLRQVAIRHHHSCPINYYIN